MFPGAKVVEPFFLFELKPKPQVGQVKRFLNSETILFLIPLPLAKASNNYFIHAFKIGNLKRKLIYDGILNENSEINRFTDSKVTYN